MSDYVELVGTGRASNHLALPAGNGRPAYNSTVLIANREEWIATRFIWSLAWLMRWTDERSGRSTLPRINEADWSGTPGAAGSRYNGRRGAIEVVNIAVVAVAHWGLETGWGVHEYNWNAAGIHCSANSRYCFREAPPTDGTVREEFIAFDGFAQFAEAYFELVSRTPIYAEAWGRMREGSADAIIELWRAGYSCGRKTRGEATSLVNRVVQTVAEEQPAWAATLPDEEQRRATAEDVPNRCRADGTPRDEDDQADDQADEGNGDGDGESSSSAVPWLLALGFGVWVFNKRNRR